MLRQKIDGSIWKGISLFAPEFPADVCVNIVSLKSSRFEDSYRFWKNGLSDSSSMNDWQLFAITTGLRVGPGMTVSNL